MGNEGAQNHKKNEGRQLDIIFYRGSGANEDEFVQSNKGKCSFLSLT